MAPTLIRPLAAIVLLAALCPAWLRAQSSTTTNPWSSIDEGGGYPDVTVAPSCHPLAYFSGSPLLFDAHRSLTFKRSYRLGDQPPLPMSYRTTQVLLGTVAGHKVYQINQSITIGPPDATPESARRIVVERKSGEYCLIVQADQGNQRYFNDATLTARNGHTILVTDDPITGNGGLSDIHAWVFDRGRPYLLDFDSVIARALARVIPSQFDGPANVVLKPQELSYTAQVSKPGDHAHEATAGYASIQFAIHGHTLTVTSAEFTPY